MSLTAKINEDLKSAMKAGERTKIDTLRSLRASILEFEKSGTDRELGADDEMKLLTTAAKKRREAIELYEQNNRPELAAQEKAELEVILSYLPQQLSRDEIGAKVREIIADVGATSPADINKVIPSVMKEMKGKADGKLVQEVVKEELGKLG